MSNLLKFALFADDTNIFFSYENVEVLQDTPNRELAKLYVQCKLLLYADDSALLIPGRNLKDIEKQLSRELLIMY